MKFNKEKIILNYPQCSLSTYYNNNIAHHIIYISIFNMNIFNNIVNNQMNITFLSPHIQNIHEI